MSGKIGRRKEALVNPFKRDNEYLGFLKTTFSTLKLFWGLKALTVEIVLTENKVL